MGVMVGRRQHILAHVLHGKVEHRQPAIFVQPHGAAAISDSHAPEDGTHPPAAAFPTKPHLRAKRGRSRWANKYVLKSGPHVVSSPLYLNDLILAARTSPLYGIRRFKKKPPRRQGRHVIREPQRRRGAENHK